MQEHETETGFGHTTLAIVTCPDSIDPTAANSLDFEYLVIHVT